MSRPQLRFEGFNSEWKVKELNDVCTFSKGKELSKSDLSEEGSPCILYGELYTKYGAIITDVQSRTNKSSINLVVGKKNDVLIPSSGETAIDIACASSLNIDNVFIGGDLNILTPNLEVNGHFLSIQINGKRKQKLSTLAQGATVTHLYADPIKKLECFFPAFEEQGKIASFFKLFNSKIQKQEEKVELLKQQKKGLMQKIFSQELRFKNEDGQDYPEWENKKLNDFADRVIRKNKDLKTNRPLTISAQFGLVDQIEYFNKNVASANLEGYYLLRKGEFAYNKSYSNGYPWGAIKRLDKYDHGALSTLYICFSIKKNVNSDFLVHYFDSAEWYKEVSIICVEGARNHGLLNVSVTEFFETLHRLPCLEEQKRISGFLDALNKKIEQNNEKLNMLVNQKKGLMQQMFI